MLRWDQRRLAREARLSLVTIRRYETGHELADETVHAIIAALEKAGVVFVDSGTIGRFSIVGAVGLRASARPEARPNKREYNYVSESRGRPKSTTKAGQGSAED